MEEIILELVKKYFIRRLSSNKISVIMSYKNEVEDILKQYPSLFIVGEYKQQFTHQFDLELI